MVLAPPKIDLLPEHLIDQIKAGEVIERPGNLIKEILENSVDAGSTKIELYLRNNGLDLISLKDNGHGMRFSDLPLAFSRHATSKISRFEDLFKLHSFGFRGEALASIAAISKLQCISKTRDGKCASELRIEGGMTTFHGERQGNSEHGTELVIQELFFNTPARLKFIQSQQAEKAFVRKIIFAFILSHPEIEFQVKADDGEKDIYSKRESSLDRLKDLFPKAQDSILYSQRFYENNEIDLYLVPGSFKGPFKLQYIFINGRYILDKQLHRVLSNALEATFGADDFHYVAHLSLPPDSIDVNVHPNKTIIKVMEVSKMISLMTSTVKELGSKKVVRDIPSDAQQIQIDSAPSFYGSPGGHTLQQERHEYNMEGLFSPHQIPTGHRDEFLWMGNFFIRRNGDSWFAVAAKKLLEAYCRQRLETASSSIPLLVSEPFPSSGVRAETIKFLQASGAELEHLGPETLVLRGIPDWMNGFPLKEVFHCLLQERSFQEIHINPLDWSQSTWEEMLETFSPPDLIEKKIMLDVPQLLRDRLK